MNIYKLVSEFEKDTCCAVSITHTSRNITVTFKGITGVTASRSYTKAQWRETRFNTICREVIEELRSTSTSTWRYAIRNDLHRDNPQLLLEQLSRITKKSVSLKHEEKLIILKFDDYEHVIKRDVFNKMENKDFRMLAEFLALGVFK